MRTVYIYLCIYKYTHSIYFDNIYMCIYIYIITFYEIYKQPIFLNICMHVFKYTHYTLLNDVNKSFILDVINRLTALFGGNCDHFVLLIICYLS